MSFRSRECLGYYQLIFLNSLVIISLIFIAIGGSLSAWCIRYGDNYECHSLLHSDRGFSCRFKLIPASIIFSLIISIFMFIILTIGRIYIEYSGVAKKEYQLVARIVNIIALSSALVLITLVLLLWYYPPSNMSRNIIVAMMPASDDTNNPSKSKHSIIFATIAPDDPSYLKAIGVRRRPMLTYDQSMNHGPYLFFAAFVILLIVLLSFCLGHRI